MRILGAALAATVLLGGAANAAPFTNGSFELADSISNSTFVNYGTGSTGITGWTVTVGNVDLVSTNYLNPDFVASDGVLSVDLNGSTAGAIAQTFDTVIGQSYHVSFDLNVNPYDYLAVPSKTVEVSVAGFTGDFVYIGTDHPVGQGGPWNTHGFDFTAIGASSTLTFTSLVHSPCCYGPEIDNVIVMASGVPEPASWALMIGGFGLVGGAMRRRAGASVLAMS